MTDSNKHESPLYAKELTLAYENSVISENLNIEIKEGKITVIIGPNACGKSTLLKALSRILKPNKGTVYLDGKNINSSPSKEVARKLGFLPQSSIAPQGITVSELVARGRFPHQQLLRQWTKKDEAALQYALRATAITDLAHREVDSLSGGQRQRVWIALTLAQDTPILLLDEPTTYLDISHQYEILELCKNLNKKEHKTLVFVLHDLNQAARYADEIIFMADGEIKFVGSPQEVFTTQNVKDIFGIDSLIIKDPVTDTPMVVPYLKEHNADNPTENI